ncbi:NAD-dependent deacetylase-like protein sirtuin-5 [Trichodelitschia bisporula]|uniref:NAD-dependent deacetylase-like protein sirtuin-5 n=1 Tax=Trichodelitschia bisporula TaxID=703511 RepID=A0A6G1HRV7_9PEZI|nr:NAD-dependent deacetylase-like protein sirtuin-5 [Trichodelitschia bisporula]
MASKPIPGIKQEDIESFHEFIPNCTRVLALIGAGLSASSGLATFRGVGGLWRNHDAMQLATPEAFQANPALVWRFYSYRRHMALKANPNPAHYALAEYSKRMNGGFHSISQNVDGLSPRAGHPSEYLHLVHGSLYDVKCTNFFCSYIEKGNYADPIVPALDLPADESDPTTIDALATRQVRELDISDASVQLPEIAEKDLPHCPSCNEGLLRPGVVWFGEWLPDSVINDIDNFINAGPIDLIMVIGTGAKVYPAASYVIKARSKGARVAVINTDPDDEPPGGMKKGDWFFNGDAAAVLPELLRPIIGELAVPT